MITDAAPLDSMESINQRLAAAVARRSPMRAIARVVSAGEVGHRVSTSAGEVAPAFGEIYASPTASSAMIDDASFDLEGWLAAEIAAEWAAAEGQAFVNGNGVNMPKGFLSAGLSTLPSGADGDFGPDAVDRLVDVVQALKPQFRREATWVMNSATGAAIRKLRTDDGAALWQPSLAANQPASLLGYPVVEDEGMPDMSPGSLSIAFGDFAAGYLIADRETRILRDAVSNKPFVHFYATKRVGGAVADADAIKLMHFSAR